MIIGSAVTLAFIKIKKKLFGNKTKQKTAYKIDTSAGQHDCSSCSAECMLRDTVPSIQNNKTSCSKIEIKSNKF